MSVRPIRRVRLLVISYTFPPVAEVGSIRISQLCGYLPDYGIEPIVLTVQEQFHEAIDPSRVSPPCIQVVRTRMGPTPISWYKIVKQFVSSPGRQIHFEHNGAKTASRHESGGLRETIVKLLQVPDRRWGWYFPAIRQSKQLLLREPVDAIFSSGPPWTSHLVARYLKKKFGLPWIVDFRDPWAGFDPKHVGPLWSYHLAKRMEGSCIRTSDLVLCNTDRLRLALQERYSDLDSVRFRTLTNGFEDALVFPNQRAKPKRLLLHLGSIYANRRIDTFLEALAGLVRSGRLDAKSVQVVFQGDIDPTQIAQVERIVPDLLRSRCVEFRPRVSWEEAWQVLWGSDLLLLFQGNHELQVPAKFYEYLQTGIPILAVTERGALTDILQETESGIWVRPSDTQAIADGLMQAMQLPKRSQEDMNKLFAKRYHYRALAEQLSVWVRELAKRHRVDGLATVEGNT